MILTRRIFAKRLLVSASSLALMPSSGWAAQKEAFSFVLLGDLHFDKLSHHDLAWLEQDKPDDLRQVREYSTLTSDILPKLFSTVRDTITDLNRDLATRVAFVLQVGDVVEGLCGNEKLATQQNTEAVEFVTRARLGVPFVFAKGNHDITGAGAPEAFKSIFHPFLTEQAAGFNGGAKLTSARYALEHGEALFCFFDAYDKESLPWLEATLAKRTARHCFVVVHPPVVPYGARATWHVFSVQRESAQRDRLIELLGKHNAFVLGGHIHKYNLLVRATPRGGRFLQLGVSSVIRALELKPEHVLSGVASYNPDQVKVEPNFSPTTEKERRAVYDLEAPLVKQFEYADLPGYAVVTVNGPRITANIFGGVERQLWRSLALPELMES
jgi:UDP-2,3-diacylglucosamine pyrophosphatase LpxH